MRIHLLMTLMSHIICIIALRLKVSCFKSPPKGSYRRSVTMTDSVSLSAFNFFKDGGVANSIGKIFEKDVWYHLFDRGYRPFLRHESPRSFTSYVEIYDDNKSLFEKGSKAIEIDALMTGNLDSFTNLCASIEDRHIPKRCEHICSSEHMLIVEAKLSLTTFLKEFAERKKSPDKPWWLLSQPNSHSFLAKALFLDGGESSVAFITRGNFSEVEIEREAWCALDNENVMIFYLPSFSVDWVREIRTEISRLQKLEETSKREIRRISDELEKLKEKFK